MSTYCNLLKITRTDAIQLGMTDLDADVTYDGLNYLTAAGYTPTQYSSNDQLSVNNADFDALRSSDSEAVYYLPPLPIVEERI